MPLPHPISDFLEKYEKTYVVTIIDGNRESWTYLMQLDTYPTQEDIEAFLVTMDSPFVEGDDVSFFPIVDVMPVPPYKFWTYRANVTKEYNEFCSFDFVFDHIDASRDEILEKILAEDIGYDDEYGKFEFYLIS